MYEERQDIFILILTLSVVSNVFAILYGISFFRTSVTSPGRVPDCPPWNSVKESDELRVYESKKTGGIRFCRWCRLTKPDRAHHCRICDTCVLKMDHHCPWMDNCIGFANQKFFLLTLFYASLGMLTMAGSAGWLNYYLTHYTSLLGIDISRLVLGIVVSVVGGILGIIVSAFFVTHIMMALRGVTTLEVLEKGRNSQTGGDECLEQLCCPSKDPRTGKPLVSGSIYKLPTVMQNLKAVLGDDVLLWAIPTAPSKGVGSKDGVIYQTTADVDRAFVEDEDDSPLIRRDQL